MGNTVDFRTNFWTDPRLAGKSGLARALLAYLNTNGHINTAGLYRIGEATISHESGLKVREIRKGFKELSGMVHWDPEAQVVLLIDFVREQFMKTGNISEKMVPSINKSLHDVPEGHHFIGYFLTKYAPLVDSIRRSNPRVPQLEYPYPIMEPPLELSGALSEKYPYSMDRVSVGYTYPTGTERGSGKGSGEGEKEEETETAEVQGNREEYSHKAHSPKHVVDFFHDACIRIRGFKPSISGKRDSQTASRALSMMSYEEVCACIESFLQSGKADAVGITLSIALSDHSINTYRQGRAGPFKSRDKLQANLNELRQSAQFVMSLIQSIEESYTSCGLEIPDDNEELNLYRQRLKTIRTEGRELKSRIKEFDGQEAAEASK